MALTLAHELSIVLGVVVVAAKVQESVNHAEGQLGVDEWYNQREF